ncbi:MAG: AMP-binding protein [Spirochaetaceae bacterium]|nr:AMP-binding protein [Spirochaetaceae bacterium]
MIYLEKMTLSALALAAVEQYRRRKAFETYGDGRIYGEMSYGEFGLRIRQFASLLRSLGVRAGDRVLILAENSPPWPAAYFGTALAGAVSVPVITDFEGAQIASIAAHAEVSACWVSARTAPRLAQAGIGADIPVIYLDSFEDPPSLLVSIGGRTKRLPLRSSWPPDGPAPFPEAAEDDLASIIYTSGTTGSSKGVMLSHRNLVFTVLAARDLLKIYSRDRLFSIIPLAHTYECTLGLLMAVLSGASTTYLDRFPTPAVLIPAIQALRPTAMHTVPLIIEKIYRGRILPALKKNPLYRFPLTRPLAVRLAGHRLQGIFGGAVRFFGIGGSGLPRDMEVFLRTAQFPYAPGYGLTEAAPLVAGTGPYRTPVGAAGTVPKGVEVRIVDEAGRVVGASGAGKGKAPSPEFALGEIQVRGPNVMMGYYRDEQRTREAFTADGWLKTGDLGCFDRKGFLYIRGRLKNLILGPSGENIYPEEIEGLLTAYGLVEDALVYPGERGELIALVVLSEKAQTMWAAAADALGELKNTVNKQLASFSRISRIEVRQEPFEKTPTRKIKRFLYGGPGRP